MGIFSSTVSTLGNQGPRVQQSSSNIRGAVGSGLGQFNNVLNRVGDTMYAAGEAAAPFLGMPRKSKVTFVLINTPKQQPSLKDLLADPTGALVGMAGNLISGTGAGTAAAKLLGLGGSDATRGCSASFELVELYVNPSNMQTQYQKLINPQQTQGGYVFQYWGEKPIEVSLNGVTGNQGIIGVNILHKVYMNQSKKLGQVDGTQDWSPAQIDMHFKGVVHTGHFTSFSVTEDATTPGIWKYDLKFTVVDTYGERTRF